MKRSLLILLVLAQTLIAAAAHAATTKVILKPQCSVATSQPVTVGDVATVEAPKAVVDKLRAVVVATAPMPGEQRPLEASYVRLRVSSAGFGSAKVVGENQITLTGKCRRIDAREIEASVRDYLGTLLPQDGCDYSVDIDRAPREMILPDDPGIEVKPRLFASTVHPGVNTVAVDAVANGRTLQTRSAVARVKVSATVLIAIEPIDQGQALTAQNTRSESRDVTNVKDPLVASSDDDQRVARRAIRAGSVLTKADVALPPTVRNGDSLTLTVRCGGVALRTSAEAKQDGRIGDSIRVRSSVSNEDVRAKITGPGTVEIVR